MDLLDATFAHPRGILGRLGGWIMGSGAKERNEWTISLLDIQPGDHILEVGFGPGVMIQELAARTPEGLVEGIDASPLMLQQASRRNKQAIHDKRVQLQQGSALALPFADATFDKAFSANSVHIWPDKFAGIKEMYRVLRSGGLIAIVVQPVWAKTDTEVKEIGEEIVKLLSLANFRDTRMEFRPMKPIASVCMLGRK